MSQFAVPNWNLRHQRQDQVDGGEGSRPLFHVQNHPNTSYVVPMSTDHEVTELTWANGQLLMHGLSNMVPSPAPNKPTTNNNNCNAGAYGRPADHTLESMIHQATCHHNHSLMNMMQSQKNEQSNMAAAGKWGVKGAAGQVQMLPPNMVKKRMRSEAQTESDQCGRQLSGSSKMHDLGTERSAGATFCRENSNNKDTTMVTWGSSFESPAATASLRTKTTDFDDSASHGCALENRDEEQEIKEGTPGTRSTRRSRAAAIHNQSERRRRDRINQKMKALQKLVPNANKTDKASMLDEVIDYLKQLQAQVHMMSTRTIMPQMMMNPLPLPLAMQQQLQISLLAARMGIHMPSPPPLQPLNTPLASPTPTFLPPAFVVPPVIPPSGANVATTANGANTSAASATGLNPFNNPYTAFLAQQKENMDFYGKMAALYSQQQANQTRNNTILPSFSQGE